MPVVPGIIFYSNTPYFHHSILPPFHFSITPFFNLIDLRSQSKQDKVLSVEEQSSIPELVEGHSFTKFALKN